MGMDYVGKNDSYHLNWTGHKFMGALLSQVGADLRQWSGSNDGVCISDKTCKEWARLLKNNTQQVRVMLIPDKSYEGGYYRMPLVCDDPFVAEVAKYGANVSKYRAESIENKMLKELTTGWTGQYLAISRMIAAQFGREEKEPNIAEIKHEDLPSDTLEWILEFAKFLENCGGCEQC